MKNNQLDMKNYKPITIEEVRKLAEKDLTGFKFECSGPLSMNAIVKNKMERKKGY